MWNRKPNMSKKYSYIISIDFDGTCVTNEWPLVGKSIGAEKVLQKLSKLGHRLILNTCRGGGDLQDAVIWFKENNIKISAVNESLNKKEKSSTKVYAKIYIDDYNLGCPLILNGIDKPYVNWIEIENMLKLKGVL